MGSLRSSAPRVAVRAVWLPLVVLLLGLGVFACRSTKAPVFELLEAPPRWPAAPEQARIEYVGELSSSNDLHAPASFASRFGALLSGGEEPGRLHGPRSIVSAPDGGRLWIADPGGACLHLFDLEARSYVKQTWAGDSPLISPVGVCLGPGDSIYLCDSGSNAIFQLDLVTGDLIEKLTTPEQLLRPVAMVYSAARDELFVVDGLSHDIKVLDPHGALLRTLGRRGIEVGEFNYPCDIAEGPGRLWIADTGNGRVQAISYDGEPLLSIGQIGNAPGDFAMPKGIALDSEGHIYVVDARFENIQVFDQTGQLLLFFGEEGGGPGQFWLPSGAFIDANDRLWVCDSYNRRIQAFDYLAEGKTDDLQTK